MAWSFRTHEWTAVGLGSADAVQLRSMDWAITTWPDLSSTSVERTQAFGMLACETSEVVPVDPLTLRETGSVL